PSRPDTPLLLRGPLSNHRGGLRDPPHRVRPRRSRRRRADVPRGVRDGGGSVAVGALGPSAEPTSAAVPSVVPTGATAPALVPVPATAVATVVPAIATRAPAATPGAVRPRPPCRGAGVGAEVDLGAAHADALHRLHLILRQAGGELDDRVVEPDGDPTDVAPAESGLVGQGPHDRSGLDVVPFAHGDPVPGHVLARTRRSRSVAEVAARPVPTPVAAVVPPLPTGGTLRLPHEEFLGVAGLRRQRRGDVLHRRRVLGCVLLDQAAEQPQI